MIRRSLPLLAASLIAGAMSLGLASAQTPEGTAPDPKLPPMPSMEGQQGDNGKPVAAVPRKAASPSPDARKPKAGTKSKARPKAKPSQTKPRKTKSLKTKR